MYPFIYSLHLHFILINRSYAGGGVGRIWRLVIKVHLELTCLGCSTHCMGISNTINHRMGNFLDLMTIPDKISINMIHIND